jgi:hypothetical protein
MTVKETLDTRNSSRKSSAEKAGMYLRAFDMSDVCPNSCELPEYHDQIVVLPADYQFCIRELKVSLPSTGNGKQRSVVFVFDRIYKVG